MQPMASTRASKPINLCDEDFPVQQTVLLGYGTVVLYIVYFAGYSRGSITINVTSGASYTAHTGPECSANDELGIFHWAFSWTVLPINQMQRVSTG